MSTAIPSLIFSLSVCLNLYLFWNQLKMVIICKACTATIVFQLVLWGVAITYLVWSAIELPLALWKFSAWMFSACLFFFAFIFTVGVYNSIKQHQLEEQ